MERKTIGVSGMACGGCEQNVETELGRLDGVDRVEADHATDTVEIVTEDTVADSDVTAAVERAGYEVVA
ncbi:MAG: heavy-metal-associated domain-containing protein [Halobaculum sp.]